ncbi:MAG: hypothetical protein JHC95_14965 [Solirubrobacteraceae bacterium]|nr:hypothetical protein [Solirubrobacteraceae bacterium]
MPPTDRLVPRFPAEPPQEGFPYGRWAETLRAEFLEACLRAAAEEELDVGEPTDIVWFPDRTWEARTWIPATARTTTGVELFGHVSFRPATEDEEADEFEAHAEATDILAEDHPDWRIDVSDHVIGDWRGEHGNVADMTVAWGVPLVQGGAIVCAELGGVTVDQCVLLEDRFTLIAPDAYRQDTLEVALYDARGRELARESLYAEDDEDEETADLGDASSNGAGSEA